MPPRKKPSSSSKKSNSNGEAQPSKFGIQHFFERHTQNALLASQKPSKVYDHGPINSDVSSSVTGSQAVAAKNISSVLPGAECDLRNSESQKRKDTVPVGANESTAVLQNTPSENSSIPAVDVENLPEASPEVSKIVSHKRFKFSPGMVFVFNKYITFTFFFGS